MGPRSVTDKPAQYEILGLKGKEAANTYGLAEKITLDKQDFQGIKAAYEFDPTAEKYVPRRADGQGPLVPDARRSPGRAGARGLRARRRRA